MWIVEYRINQTSKPDQLFFRSKEEAISEAKDIVQESGSNATATVWSDDLIGDNKHRAVYIVNHQGQAAER